MRPINFGYWKEENGQRVFVTTSEHALEVQNKVAERLALIAYLLQRCGCGIISAVNLPELGVSAYRVASEIAVRAWRLSEKVDKQNIVVAHYKMNNMYDQLDRASVYAALEFATNYCTYGIGITRDSHVVAKPFSDNKRMEPLCHYVDMLGGILRWMNANDGWRDMASQENDTQYIMPYDPLRKRFVIAAGLPTSPYIAGLYFAYKAYSNLAQFANDAINKSRILYNAVHVPGVSVPRSLGYAQRAWTCGDYGKTYWSEISEMHFFHYGQEAVLIHTRDSCYLPFFKDSTLNYTVNGYLYGDSFSFYGNEITVGNPEVRGDNSPVPISAHVAKAKTVLRTFAVMGD